MYARRLSMFAVAAAMLATSAGPAAAATGHEVDGLVTDLRVADGVVRLASAYPSRSVDARLVALTLAGGGNPVRTTLLRSSANRGWVTPALTADGAVIAYAWQRTAKSKPVVQVVTADGTGSLSDPETLSAPGASARPLDPVEVGPTGTVALRFMRGGPKTGIQYLAVRRASATGFGGPIALGTARESRATDFHVLLGADGGGLLVGVPQASLQAEPYAQRITPEGTLGPRMPTGFGAHDETDVAMAFGPTGTFLLAGASVDRLERDPESSARVASLAPGAAAFSPVQTLPSGPGYAAPDRENLSVAVGPGDHTAVTVAAGTHDLTVFDGAPTSLAKVATLPAQFPFDAHVFISPDDALTAIWSDVKARGEQLAGSPVIRVTRTAIRGRTFGKPHTAFKPRAETATLSQAALLRDGRVAIVVDQFEGGTEGTEALLPSIAAIVQP